MITSIVLNKTKKKNKDKKFKNKHKTKVKRKKLLQKHKLTGSGKDHDNKNKTGKEFQKDTKSLIHQSKPIDIKSLDDEKIDDDEISISNQKKNVLDKISIGVDELDLDKTYENMLDQNPNLILDDQSVASADKSISKLSISDLEADIILSQDKDDSLLVPKEKTKKGRLVIDPQTLSPVYQSDINSSNDLVKIIKNKKLSKANNKSLSKYVGLLALGDMKEKYDKVKSINRPDIISKFNIPEEIPSNDFDELGIPEDFKRDPKTRKNLRKIHRFRPPSPPKTRKKHL